MKIVVVGTIAAFVLLSAPEFQAQNSSGLYEVKSSEVFKTPKRHAVKSPIGYGKEGIIQVSSRGSQSFVFQLFDNGNLRLERTRVAGTENKLNEHTRFNRFVKLKTKTYLFVRDVNKDAKTEGISALEFLPHEMSFNHKAKELFQSSGKIRIAGGYQSNSPNTSPYGYGSSMGFGYYGGYSSTINNPSLGTASDYDYNFTLSKDKTAFLFTYSMVPKEKRDAYNKDVIGMHVFDENLNKLWGGEYEMPYTEAKMDNLGYMIANDGKVYLLAKVYETERPRQTDKKNQPNFYFELFVYEKDKSIPTSVKLKLDEYFPKEVFIYEDTDNNVAVAGFYSKNLYGPVNGSYLVKLNVKDGVASRMSGDFYEIPNEIIKSYVSDREKRRLEKRENRDPDGEIGVDNLRVRQIYQMPDGSTKIVAEQYVVSVYSYYDPGTKSYRTSYNTNADDIFIISINKTGKQDWVKKIPKSQYSNDAYGNGLSINSLVVGNDLHVFYIDNIKNLNLQPNEPPKTHINGRGGFLTAVKIDAMGNVQKSSLGEIKQYKTNFFIRGFVNGEKNNLISTERRKKKNKLISVEVK